MNSSFISISGKKIITTFGIIMITGIIFISCQSDREKTNTPEVETKQVPGYNPYKDADLSVEVFKVDSIEHNGSRGWGYDIMVNQEIHIHQPNIPAVMGNNGFSSEEKALTAGEFVIQKLKNNVSPPSVTPEELDSLGVLD